MPIKLNLNLSRSNSSKNEISEEATVGAAACNVQSNSILPSPECNTTYTTCHGNNTNNVPPLYLIPPKPSQFSENISTDYANGQPLKRELSCKSLFSLDGQNQKVNMVTKMNPSTMRKSETVLALTNCTPSPSTSSSTTKTVKDRILSSSSNALNSLFNSSTSKLFGFKVSTNSQHSSTVKHLAAKSTAVSGVPEDFFIVTRPASSSATRPADTDAGGCGAAPLTPTNRLRKNWSARKLGGGLCSNSSLNSMVCEELEKEENDTSVPCRLCLSNVKLAETVQLQCSCRYCKDCMIDYISFEIQEGAYEIACPDSSCEKQGVLSLEEVETLVCSQLVEKYKTFRLYREVEKDCQLTWCPNPGCETICRIEEVQLDSQAAEDGKKKSVKRKSKISSPTKFPSRRTHMLKIQCSECGQSFCAECKLNFHPQQPSCEAYRKKLVKTGKLTLVEDEEFIFHGLNSIKKCPFCHVPIEKDSGCAQMMCKRCKHVFCWYCLESLDDDFLLRHYDKGPCKNKLGHSRASIIWHRVQVIGIFTGFGILVLLASPVLLLAAPCLLCCRCRYCSTKSPSTDSDLSSTSTSSQHQQLASTASNSSD